MWNSLIDGLNQACKDTFSNRESYTYKYRDGSSTPIKGIFDKNYISVDPDSGATISANTPVLGIVASDLSRKPYEGDSVLIDSVEYMVMEQQPDSEGMIKLILREKY